MKNCWLLKSDPDDYTFDALEREGETVWDGVSNNLALQNLRKIKMGDDLLIYHTGSEKALVGLARAASDPYPDPNGDNPKLVVIDVKLSSPRKARSYARRDQTDARIFILSACPTAEAFGGSR